MPRKWIPPSHTELVRFWVSQVEGVAPEEVDVAAAESWVPYKALQHLARLCEEHQVGVDAFEVLVNTDSRWPTRSTRSPAEAAAAQVHNEYVDRARSFFWAYRVARP